MDKKNYGQHGLSKLIWGIKGDKENADKGGEEEQ